MYAMKFHTIAKCYANRTVMQTAVQKYAVPKIHSCISFFSYLNEHNHHLSLTTVYIVYYLLSIFFFIIIFIIHIILTF